MRRVRRCETSFHTTSDRFPPNIPSLAVAWGFLALLFTQIESAWATAGDVDPSFGTNGLIVTTLSFPSDAYAALQQSDGKIVVAGSIANGVSDDVVLLRYNVDGTLDHGFGSSGVVIAVDELGHEYSNGLAVQSDGKLLIGGSRWGTTWDFLTMRFNRDGSPDAEFGDAGRVLTPVGPLHDFGSSVALQADGKIIVGGTSNRPGTTNYDAALVRFHPDGALDVSFGNGGVVTSPISGREGGIAALAVQADGRLIGVGRTFGTGTREFLALRFHANGTLDSEFGSSGIGDDFCSWGGRRSQCRCSTT